MKLLCLVFAIHSAAFGRDDKKDEFTVELLTATLGKGETSKEYMALTKQLKVAPEVAKFDDCFYHTWKDRGISILFKKDRVSAIQLFADKVDGFTGYRGPLPSGVKFSHTLGEVEKRLGETPDTVGGDGDPFCANYPEKGLNIKYDSEDKKSKIRQITLFPPQKK